MRSKYAHTHTHTLIDISLHIIHMWRNAVLPVRFGTVDLGKHVMATWYGSIYCCDVVRHTLAAPKLSNEYGLCSIAPVGNGVRIINILHLYCLSRSYGNIQLHANTRTFRRRTFCELVREVLR